MSIEEEETARDNAASEKLLGDIIGIAEDAIYDATGRAEDRRSSLYAGAIDRIRNLLGASH